MSTSIRTTSAGLLGDLRWHGRIFDGEWFVSTGGTREVLEPANGKSLGTVGIGNAQDVAVACEAAAKAQRSWASRSARERSAIFVKAAAVLENAADECAPIVASETGGIPPKGMHEVKEAVALLHAAAALALGAAGRCCRAGGAAELCAPCAARCGRRHLAIQLSADPVHACGGAGIGERERRRAQARSADAVCRAALMIARVLQEAGLPAGVLHVIPGAADAGEALCLDKNVQMIQFTGSTQVGRRVAELAGRTLKKVSLELGGNNALIVLDDADIDAAVNNAAWGAWLHQGQICMASSRIFVQQAVLAEFTRKLAKAQSQGNPAPVALAHDQRAPTTAREVHRRRLGAGRRETRSRRQQRAALSSGHSAFRCQARHARLSRGNVRPGGEHRQFRKR